MGTTRDDGGRLLLGGVDLAALTNREDVGTPSYVYDLDAIALEARVLGAAFEGARHKIAYAMKANSAGPILRALHAEGCGVDVVSGAELALALATGLSPEEIVYSGVAKRNDEIDRAISAGEHGIGAIQLESVEEIARVDARAGALRRRARVSLRINPAASRASLETHAHIATGHDEAKFGILRDDVPMALERLRSAHPLDLVGLTVHAGSQFTSTDAYVAAAAVLFGIVRGLPSDRATKLDFVDTGGGFGVDYGQGCSVAPADFVRAVRVEQRRFGLDDLALYVEPGRSLVASHGVLLARVVQPKSASRPSGHPWLFIDAGMNDLIRPALYQARHRIVALSSSDVLQPWRVAGPVCESSDDFGEHDLPKDPPHAVAILDAGAYGFSMASQYNGRPLPAEVFLRGGRVALVSPRALPEKWVSGRILPAD